MVFRDDSGLGERPIINEFDGLAELVEDVEAALEKAEEDGVTIKWLKARPPIVAIDFPRGTSTDAMDDVYEDYLSEHVPEDDYEIKILEMMFGSAIEIHPQDYPYYEEELPSFADELKRGDADGGD